jgi:hypothetical protein
MHFDHKVQHREMECEFAIDLVENFLTFLSRVAVVGVLGQRGVGIGDCTDAFPAETGALDGFPNRRKSSSLSQ